MTRIRHEVSKRKPLYRGPDSPSLAPVPEGSARCPGCMQPVVLTTRGRLRKHKDAWGVECPVRAVVAANSVPDRSEFPPIELPRARVQQKNQAVQEPGKRPTSKYVRQVVTGRCHECDRRISGCRTFCGPCLAKRKT